MVQSFLDSFRVGVPDAERSDGPGLAGKEMVGRAADVIATGQLFAKEKTFV